MKRPLLFSLALACAPLAPASTDTKALLDSFRDWISKSQGAADLKEEALKTLEAESEDAAEVITGALKKLYPDFAAALPDLQGSTDKLLGMAKSPDPFLAAESAYYLGRTYFSRKDYEAALPLMERLRGDLLSTTPREAEALYYLGMCQANSLRKADALENLQMFIEDYPTASERLLMSAKAMIDGLKNVLDGTPEDIADHMDFARRRLALTDSGEKTQEVQGKVVDMLDKLIKALEEQNQQNQSSSQQQQQQKQQEESQGQKKGQQNSQGDNPQVHDSPKSVRKTRGAAKSAWDDLRQRERKTDALSGAKSKYPPRYRELVDQYFNDLQSENETGK